MEADVILVTGGAGFIGAHTTRALLDLGVPAVVASRRAALPALLPPDVPVERVDCTDPDALLAVGERRRITGIVHLAAVGLTGDPLAELWAGARSAFAVLYAARAWGVDRVVVASTVGVYAGVHDVPWREDAPLPVASAHPIPAAKKVAEVAALAAGPEAVVARIGAIWGPLGRPASPFIALPRLVHAAVRPAPAEAPAGTPPEALPGAPAGAPAAAPAGVSAGAAAGVAAEVADGTSVGTPSGTGVEVRDLPRAGDTADLCYARDCGRALALLAVTAGLRHRVYNVSGGRPVANREVAAAIERAVPGAAPRLAEGAGPHAGAHLDVARLRDDTGWAPAWDLDRAVADYVAWLRAGHPR